MYAYDIIAILKNKKKDVRDLWIDIDKTQAGSSPKVYTSINFHIVITGINIDNETVETAVKLASEKYCSASIMLGKTAKMSYTYEVKEYH